MRWMLVIALFGCGGSQTHERPPQDPESPPERVQADEHRALCERASVLATIGCEPFDRMDPSLLAGRCDVVTSFQLAGMDQCLYQDSCETLTACFTKTRAAETPPPYRGPVRDCKLPKDHPDLGAPAGFSRDEIAQSHGANAHTYADAPSTKDQPIEVCGFPAAGSWLARMTCKDGSHPLASRNDAERIRVGNVGEGGRCGRIIDQYAVECPETTYDIFIDAYRCERR